MRRQVAVGKEIQTVISSFSGSLSPFGNLLFVEWSVRERRRRKRKNPKRRLTEIGH